MNKQLEDLIVRATTWSEAAQDEAARALAAIEEKHLGGCSLTAEEQAKVADLRHTIERSIEAGGSYTDEEIAAYIDSLHAEQESR